MSKKAYDKIQAGLLDAVKMAKAGAEALGGKGAGGRPDLAQGGGPDGHKAQEALQAVKRELERQIKQEDDD